MDVELALAELMEVSSQVEAAVVLDESGEVRGATLADAERARELARAARKLLSAAERARPDSGRRAAQVDAATREGSVFVVREGPHTIAATTPPAPTAGLVFYDLKTCLRALAEEEQPDARP